MRVTQRSASYPIPLPLTGCTFAHASRSNLPRSPPAEWAAVDACGANHGTRSHGTSQAGTRAQHVQRVGGGGVGVGVGGKPPCAAGTYSTQEAGTRSRYAPYASPGAHVSTRLGAGRHREPGRHCTRGRRRSSCARARARTGGRARAADGGSGGGGGGGGGGAGLAKTHDAIEQPRLVSLLDGGRLGGGVGGEVWLGLSPGGSPMEWWWCSPPPPAGSSAC